VVSFHRVDDVFAVGDSIGARAGAFKLLGEGGSKALNPVHVRMRLAETT